MEMTLRPEPSFPAPSQPCPGTGRRLSRGMAVLGVILLAGAIAGCAGRDSRDHVRPPSLRPILFSPNAEPLSGGPLGHPACEEAMSAWFDRVDANHDGVIDRTEFLTDARQQFERMDRHKAGYVTAADLSDYRAPYEPQSTPVVPLNDPLASPSPYDRARGGTTSRPLPGALRGPEVDTRADPVMSADKSLNFKVTTADFMAQAEEIFAGLDHNHDGRVTRDAVVAGCSKTDKRR